MTTVQRRLLGLIVSLALSIGIAAPTRANGVTVYLPIVLKDAVSPTPPADKNDIPAYVNYYRALAGVPAVTFDPALNDNCFQHARYMAVNNHLTHNQNPGLPFASPAGQVCAGNGNAWLGGGAGFPFWEPHHSVDGWMESVGHRLWLLYPTTPTFGFGF
jgi:uncharacterized protein YkwD